MWGMLFWEMPAFKGELGKKETLKVNQHSSVVVHNYVFQGLSSTYSFFFFLSPLFVIFFHPLIPKCFISSHNQGDTVQPFSKLILCLWYYISSTDLFSACTRTIYRVSCISVSCSASSILICQYCSQHFYSTCSTFSFSVIQC